MKIRIQDFYRAGNSLGITFTKSSGEGLGSTLVKGWIEDDIVSTCLRRVAYLSSPSVLLIEFVPSRSISTSRSIYEYRDVSPILASQFHRELRFYQDHPNLSSPPGRLYNELIRGSSKSRRIS